MIESSSFSSHRKFTKRFSKLDDVEFWWGGIHDKDISSIRINRLAANIITYNSKKAAWFKLLDYPSVQETAKAYNISSELIAEE